MPSFMIGMLEELGEGRGMSMLPDLDSFVERQMRTLRQRSRRRRLRDGIDLYNRFTLYLIPGLIIAYMVSMPLETLRGTPLWLWIVIIALLVGRLICQTLIMQDDVDTMKDDLDRLSRMDR